MTESPPRAADIDVDNGKSHPSALIADTIRYGCPDLARDGASLVYQGYVRDGRPFAFVSRSSDGRDGTPVIATADPTVSSDPRWLSDGHSFVFDVDASNVGVFSTVTSRTTIISAQRDVDYDTIFHRVVGDYIFVSGVVQWTSTDLVGFEWPTLRQFTRQRIAGFVVDPILNGSKHLYAASLPDEGIIDIDMIAGRSRRIGSVEGQFLRELTFVPGGLAFVSATQLTDIAVVTENGELRRVTNDGTFSCPSRCGTSVFAERMTNRANVIVRINIDTGAVEQLTSGPNDVTPSCARDGKLWFYASWTPRPKIYKCERQRCASLADESVMALAASPDGQRVAYVTSRKRGPVVEWIPAAGGRPRFVMESETACDPVWSSNRVLWVSRRLNSRPTWTEIDTDTGRPTGRELPGSRSCADGIPDPVSPVPPQVRQLSRRVSQVRLVPIAELGSPF